MFYLQQTPRVYIDFQLNLPVVNPQKMPQWRLSFVKQDVTPGERGQRLSQSHDNCSVDRDTEWRLSVQFAPTEAGNAACEELRVHEDRKSVV